MIQQYQSRLERLQKYMLTHNVDVVMVTDPKNIFYLTGFLSDPYERFMSLVIDSRNDHMYLIVPTLDNEKASKESYVKKIVAVNDEENPFHKLAELIDGKIMSLGIEKDDMNLRRYEALCEVFKGVTVNDIGSYIMSMRMKKSQDEVKAIGKAIRTIEKVLSSGLEKVELGMSEVELTAELEYQMRVHGADGPSFSTIVLSGEKTALPHGHPGKRRFKQGDLLLIDMGVIMDGYCSDITRTFVIGEGSFEQNEIHKIVLESTQKAIEAIRVGDPLHVIDDAARQHINKSGYGSYFNNRVGHGLGIDVHESPSIHSRNSDDIAPGLLFTIEPGIYIPGKGGVRIEENVYIHESGAVEVLTNFPRELKSL